MSAEESVKHALLLLDMASSFLAIRPDISRLPSISGYAMFVACTVHFKSLVAQSRLQKYGTNRVKGAVCVLEQLKAYWATNQDLVCDIHFTQSSEITDQDNQWDTLKNLYASKGIDIKRGYIISGFLYGMFFKNVPKHRSKNPPKSLKGLA